MKLSFVVTLLCLAVNTFGQTNANKETIAQDQLKSVRHKKHCNATRVGEGVMLGGGGLAAGAGITYLVLAAANSGDRDARINSGMVCLAIGSIGMNFALDGAVVFLVGKLYERHHKSRFSVISTPNRVGLSYNF